MKKQLLFILFCFLIFSFSFAQAPKWVWAESAGGSYMNALDIYTDANGYAYVSGYFEGGSVTLGNVTLTNTGYFDMFIAKYDPNGNVVWAKSAGGDNNDGGNGVAVDGAGNVYVVGDFQSSTITFGSITLTNTSSISFYIVKYDPNGNVLWANSPVGGAATSGATHVAVDYKGNVYMSGCFSTSTFAFGSITLNSTAGGGNNFYIAKFDPNGNALWAQTANAAGNGNGQDNAIATDLRGNVYATGYNSGATQTFGSYTLNQIGSYDVFTVKYDSSGNVRWAKNFGGNGGSTTSNAMAVDTSGAAYVVGYINAPSAIFGLTTLNNNSSGYAYFIVKYDSAGNPKWGQSESGGSGGSASYEYGTGVATDLNGNVYATSYYTADVLTIGSYTLNSNGTNNYSSADGFLAKYDSAGNVLWAHGFESEWNAAPNAISIDNGNIYVGGTFTSDSLTFGNTTLIDPSPGTNTAFIVKLSTCGLNVSASTTSSSCGMATGTATANVSNGTPPYNYQWTNGSKEVTADSLASGVYIATVTDNVGCVASGTANVKDAGAPTITVNAVTNVTCSGANTGSINILVTGGVTPYTYYWDNGSTIQNISNLAAGPYQIEITDANGCKVTQVISISQPPPFALSLSTTTSTCNGADGGATATVSGGTGAYTYLWTPSGQSSYSAVSLSAGSYSLAVTDSAGCSATATADVENINGPIVNVTGTTNASCFTGMDGGIVLSVAGGTTPYSYLWSNGATTTSITAPTGYYNITVTDGVGCKGITSAQILDTLPSGVSICEVTVDTNQENEILWNKTSERKIASFNIYRDTTTTGIYHLAASQPYDSLSMWIDSIAAPQSRGYRYKISEVDSCGDESVLSNPDRTIHLTVDAELPTGTFKLIWDDNYEGLVFNTYYIFRDTVPTSLTLIDSVPNNGTQTYTDYYVTTKNIYYRVGINNPNGCTPTRSHGPVKYGASHSNEVTVMHSPTAVATIKQVTALLTVYPNPANQNVNIKVDGITNRYATISVTDVTGRELIQANGIVTSGMAIPMDVSVLSAGMYFVKVTASDFVATSKFIKQ